MIKLEGHVYPVLTVFLPLYKLLYTWLVLVPFFYFQMRWALRSEITS